MSISLFYQLQINSNVSHRWWCDRLVEHFVVCLQLHFIASKSPQRTKTMKNVRTQDMKLAWKNAHSHINPTMSVKAGVRKVFVRTQR